MRARLPAIALASGLAALVTGEARAEFPERDFQGVIMWAPAARPTT
ncbi:MAG TPA: hypothetical protein VLE23_05950 [Geminicoccaceae bacterium]|nr:hypothetical protein [Geminicoccaceae bacterium]